MVLKNENSKLISDYQTLNKHFSNLNDVFIEYRASYYQERHNSMLEFNKAPFRNEVLGFQSIMRSSLYSKNCTSLVN